MSRKEKENSRLIAQGEIRGKLCFCAICENESIQSCQPHLSYLVVDVLPESIAGKDFDVGEQTEHETAESSVIADFDIEHPMAVAVGSEATDALRIFLDEKITGKLTEP